MNIDKEILLNDFAIKSFRDTADLDYIAARLAYQSRLMPQALWSGLQSIEKYFKCILLLNRINIKNDKLGHDIEKALKVIEDKLPFSINLSASTLEYISHLNMYV